MHLSVKPVKRFALAAIAAAVLCVGPGSSVASAAYAEWTPPGTAKISGQLEFKIAEGSLVSPWTPVTCTISQGATLSGSTLQRVPYPGMPSPSPCSNGKSIYFTLHGLGEKEAGVFTYTNFPATGYSPMPSPWGGTFEQGWAEKVPFTNGAAGTSSKITFSNKNVGARLKSCCPTWDGWVTATGVLKITTSTGGLVTLK